MPPMFHTTIYCCLFCGRDFEVSEWLAEDAAAAHEPILSCPFCERAAFRADYKERDMIKEYVRLKNELTILATARLDEEEMGAVA